MDTLRGIEGRVAQAYFTAWRSIPLRWKGLGRKPIPEETEKGVPVSQSAWRSSSVAGSGAAHPHRDDRAASHLPRSPRKGSTSARRAGVAVAVMVNAS